MTTPRYEIGKSVNVGYLGLVDSYTAATDRAGQKYSSDYIIISVRFEGGWAADEDGTVFLDRSSGWSYLISSPTRGDWGWVGEATLTKLHY